jgi:O-antigen/teichoic acid export membrane protein
MDDQMKMLRLIPVVVIFFGAVLLFEQPAYAYADPGTGLLAVQAAGSAIVATGWYLRRKIYALLHRSDAKAKSEFSTGVNAEDSPNS